MYKLPWQGDKPVEDYIAGAGLPKPRKHSDKRKDFGRDFWNAARQVMHSNCYGYALNVPKWIHVGDIGIHPSPKTVSPLFNKAVADGLIPAPSHNPPYIKGYYLVALVSGQGWHWYRKDGKKSWSHKDGGSPVSDYDDAGEPIRDPRMAARERYPNFVGYFYVPNKGLDIRC